MNDQLTEAEIQKDLLDDVYNEISHLSDNIQLTDKENKCLQEVINDYVRFDPVPMPTEMLERVYIEKDHRWIPTSGKSINPGNLMLNLGKLFESIVSGVGAYLTAPVNPFFAVLCGIVAFRSLIGAATKELTQDDALILWAISTCEQKGKQIIDKNILKIANDENIRVGNKERLSIEAIRAGLERLENIHIVIKEKDQWYLVESVFVST